MNPDLERCSHINTCSEGVPAPVASMRPLPSPLPVHEAVAMPGMFPVANAVVSRQSTGFAAARLSILLRWIASSAPLDFPT